MAIDSAAKRYSAFNATSGRMCLPGLIPDGTIAGVDRQHLLNLYTGIAVTTYQPLVYSAYRELSPSLVSGNREISPAIATGNREISPAIATANRSI